MGVHQGVRKKEPLRGELLAAAKWFLENHADHVPWHQGTWHRGTTKKKTEVWITCEKIESYMFILTSIWIYFFIWLGALIRLCHLGHPFRVSFQQSLTEPWLWIVLLVSRAQGHSLPLLDWSQGCLKVWPVRISRQQIVLTVIGMNSF